MKRSKLLFADARFTTFMSGDSVETKVKNFAATSRFIRDPAFQRHYWGQHPEYEGELRSILGDAFTGFTPRVITKSFTDDITGDIVVYDEIELPAGPRDRLLQLIGNENICPRGSYGWVMNKALIRANAVVGNACAAKIDQFFASRIEDLKKPYTDELAKELSEAETEYWRQQTGLDFIAGGLLTAAMRKRITDIFREDPAKEDPHVA